jgi:VWFA-related protein
MVLSWGIMRLPQPRTLFLHSFFVFICAMSGILAAQTPGASESTPTFHASSRLVVVNVVVTDRDGKPITGLKKEDFELLEDGKTQPLQVFESHVPVRQAGSIPDLHLGPGEFTNFPKMAANSAINVILFDILNTPTDDQLYARQQMIEFLKTLPRGQRVALFTLGEELRMLTGFTTGTEELIAAAYKLRPGVSSLLDTQEEIAHEDHVFDQLYSGATPSSGAPANFSGGGNPAASLGTGGVTSDSPNAGLVNSVDAGGPLSMSKMMEEFTNERRLVRTDLRVQKTFEAMGALARALSGYTGRKNLFWLSEAFPGTVLPNREDSRQNVRNYLAIFQKYSGQLESAQISVYPIDLRGLKNSALQGIGGSPEFVSPVRRDADMVGSQLTMRDVADQTGGRAFYNTNDIKVALQRGMEHGATYYTLAYAPQNQNWNGAFRRIAVKSGHAGVRLDFRRGYYATRDAPSPVDAAHRTMVAEMQPGVPESTMLLLRVKITATEGTSDNVGIDYGVYAPDLAFTGDAIKHARLEFVAVAWDRDNKPAANISQTMDLDLQPETFKKIQNTGVPAHQDLTLKPGDYKLRMGVMDYATGKIGTMEVPVTVRPAQTASK